MAAPAAVATPAAAAPSPVAPVYPTPSASLYVGGLHPDVSEHNLYETFSKVASVTTVKVCRDHATRRSLGYGYINFQTPQDAERVLDTMNHVKIRDIPCRIMWSNRDPSLRRSGKGNIYIKNLDKSVDDKALDDTFSTFGNIISSKIVYDEAGVSTGVAYVHYDDPEAARRAIEAVHGNFILNKKLYVSDFISRRDRPQSSGEKTFNNLLVKNFAQNLDDAKLKEMFSKAGEIISSLVQTDENGVSKGFGYVCYRDPADARKAIEMFNGATVGDLKIEVCRHLSKAERKAELARRQEARKKERLDKYPKDTNLYIRYLADDVDDETLLKEFGRIGSIVSAKVARDEKGLSRGFGFVSYTNADDAKRAISEFNGATFHGKPLYVGLHEYKEARAARLAEQRMNSRVAPIFTTGVMAHPMYLQNRAMVYPVVGRHPIRGQSIIPARPAGAPYTVFAGATNVRPGGPRGPAANSRVRPVTAPNGHQQPGPRRNQPRQGGNVKYNANTRGAPVPPQAATENAEAVVNAETLAKLSPEEQKQTVGNLLYGAVSNLITPAIAAAHPEEDVAGRITGMILERFEGKFLEALPFVENREEVSKSFNEAMVVISKSKAESA